MEHSVVGQVGRAFGLWGQACLVLLRNPQLLVLQVAVAFLLTFLRLVPIASNVPLIFPLMWAGCLYFLNAFLSHYTMHYVQSQRVNCKDSFFAALDRYKQLLVYLLLFLPFVYLFLYEPPTPYGQKLFFAAQGIGEDAQWMNIYTAKALFVLLALLLLFIFIVQHVALVGMWSGETSYKQTISRAWHLLRPNAVTIISLACWLFLSSFLSLVLLRMAIMSIPNWLNLTMAYYIMTVSLNLYCMALTILYYDRYVKHERVSQ